MKGFIRKSWNYIVAVMMPWIIVLLHFLITKKWFGGEGCILAGDAGNVYYPMYMELWEKMHHGGSLFFTWNAGMGMNFLVYVFRYLMSPATLVILLLPKSAIASAIQFFMIMKWSLLCFTMLYYFMHTKHNPVTLHKKLTALLFTMAFCLSNAMIENVARTGWYDVLILFPVLLLLTEQVQDGRKRGCFWFCMTACILCNFSMSVPLTIFLVLWYGIHGKGKEHAGKNGIAFLSGILLSYLTAMVTVLPCILFADGNWQLHRWNDLSSYIREGMLSVVNFVHRWFLLDEKGITQESLPMFYCSVTLLAVALLFVFVKDTLWHKVTMILLAFLLILGMMNGGMNLVWHGYVGVDTNQFGFSYLLIFMAVYMAMYVLGNLESIRIWHVLAVSVCGMACVAYTFLNVHVLLDFYVYLVTLLIFVLAELMLFFYCKKSIKHTNIYVVLAVLAFLELGVNGNVRFLDYNAYPVETLCYRSQNEALIHAMDLAPGQRVAVPQDIENYNMICSLPSVAGESAYTDDSVGWLYGRLGLGWSEGAYSFSGASPLVNAMMNVRYGISAGDCAFDDTLKVGENNGVQLCSMNRLAGTGYMVRPSVTEWDLKTGSPFVVQNDFIKHATGGEEIFNIVVPDTVRCDSVFPKDPSNRIANMGAATHGMEKKYAGIYDPVTGYYMYEFINGYYGEDIRLQFVSDGKTDYYVYVKSGCSQVSHVVIDGETVYSDALPALARSYHIGVVEKGKMIQIISNMEVENDNMTRWGIQYQFAGFLEENYQKAYEVISRETLQIDRWEDTYVSGTINVLEAGVMTTSIPAESGFTVYVDGKQTDYEKIGDALIGVFLDAGSHKVEFRYRMPYIKEGMILSILGLVAGIIIYGLPYFRARRKRESSGETGEV